MEIAGRRGRAFGHETTVIPDLVFHRRCIGLNAPEPPIKTTGAGIEAVQSGHRLAFAIRWPLLAAPSGNHISERAVDSYERSADGSAPEGSAGGELAP